MIEKPILDKVIDALKEENWLLKMLDECTYYREVGKLSEEDFIRNQEKILQQLAYLEKERVKLYRYKK